MPLGETGDVFTKLSVGDGLVSQIPALIVSLSAALLVSKGGTRGATEKACCSVSCCIAVYIWPHRQSHMIFGVPRDGLCPMEPGSCLDLLMLA
jgi:FHIPEP family